MYSYGVPGIFRVKLSLSGRFYHNFICSRLVFSTGFKFQVSNYNKMESTGSDLFYPFNHVNITDERNHVVAYNLANYCYIDLVNPEFHEKIASIGSLRRPSVDMVVIYQYYNQTDDVFVDNDDMKSYRIPALTVDKVAASLFKKKEDVAVRGLLSEIYQFAMVHVSSLFISVNVLLGEIKRNGKKSSIYSIIGLVPDYVGYCFENNLFHVKNSENFMMNPFIPFTFGFGKCQSLANHMYSGILQRVFTTPCETGETGDSKSFHSAREANIHHVLFKRANAGLTQILENQMARQSLLNTESPFVWKKLSSPFFLCSYDTLGIYIYNKLNMFRERIQQEESCFTMVLSRLDETTEIIEAIRKMVRKEFPSNVPQEASGDDERTRVSTSSPYQFPNSPSPLIFAARSTQSSSPLIVPRRYTQQSPSPMDFDISKRPIKKAKLTTTPITPGTKQNGIISDGQLNEIFGLLYPELNDKFKGNPISSELYHAFNRCRYDRKVSKHPYTTRFLLVLLGHFNVMLNNGLQPDICSLSPTIAFKDISMTINGRSFNLTDAFTTC